jgi:hypothetical protein
MQLLMRQNPHFQPGRVSGRVSGDRKMSRIRGTGADLPPFPPLRADSTDFRKLKPFG